MRLSPVAACLSAVALTLCAAEVSAQATSPDLQAVLDRAGTTLRQRGFSPLGPVQSGSLATEEGAAPTLTLSAGRYVIVGACDSACANLDLRVLDPGGTRVAQEALVNRAPRLEFTLRREDDYTLYVDMKACRARECRWAAQVWRAVR